MEKALLKTLCLSFLLLSATAFSQEENSFSGIVTYHDSYGMTGVTAHLRDSTGTIIDNVITDNSGNYTFNNVAPGDYTVTFTTDQPAGGVNLIDPFIIQDRISGLITFDNIQELAADVDGNGIVNQDDYNLILIAYMNQENPFPVGPWVFEQRSVTMPEAAREGFTTRGTSSGDSNGSLVPDPKSTSILLTNPIVSLNAGSSDPIEFKLSSGENFNIEGMHLVLNIPEGLSVIKVESAIPEANVSVINNQVRVTWMDETRKGFEIVNGMPLLNITTKSTSVSRDGNNYSLRLGSESHFINAEGELISGITLVLPTINISNVKDMEVSVYPNPFTENTNINYVLREDGKVAISLFDQAGKKVKEIINGDNSAGNHEVKIEGTDLMPGIYHYCIIYTGSDQLINTGTIIKSK
jgi:uncharacterized protein (DUF2141 family)